MDENNSLAKIRGFCLEYGKFFSRPRKKLILAYVIFFDFAS